jgi:hypothetical protein
VLRRQINIKMYVEEMARPLVADGGDGLQI